MATLPIVPGQPRLKPIDPHSATPSYAQLADQLRGMIRDGAYGPGSYLPSQPQLVQETGLSRGTVIHALKTLEDEGLIRSVPGRGTVVLPA